MKTKLLRKIRHRFSINYFNGEWHIIDTKKVELTVWSNTYYAAYYMCKRLGYEGYAYTSLQRRTVIIESRLKQIENDNRRSIQRDNQG